MIKIIETIGTVFGIIGAFLVASKIGDVGYQFFFISSALLLTSSIRQRQWNFVALQGTFFLANIWGLINHVTI